MTDWLTEKLTDNWPTDNWPTDNWQGNWLTNKQTDKLTN